MIRKCIYKVIKSFVLTKNKQNELGFSEDVDTTKGTYFSKGEVYVDYKSFKKGDTITLITELLIDRGFLKLISKVDL